MKNSSQSSMKDMLGRSALKAVSEAQKLLLENVEPIQQTETKKLHECLDRIVAVEITAPEDLPTHPRSTMDGYAVIAADTFGASESMPCYLPIAGEVFMGEMPSQKLRRGNCMRIATGGLLPEGADSVVMFEHTVPVDENMIEVVKSVGQGANIIGSGDDIKMGSPALPAGRRLLPQDLGLLAGLGITSVEVFRKIRFGIVSTGDEIVACDSQPPPGKVRNINSITLSGQAQRIGAEIRDYGIVADRQESFFPAIEKAVTDNDVVVFSGGSSVGTRDLGEQAVATLGSPGLLVHGVALKPGKPILIGLHGTTPIFGLPGHPVSAMVCFDLFVAPAMRKLMGETEDYPAAEPWVDAVLGRNIASAPGRRDIVRVQLERSNGVLTAYPVLGKSGSISTLSRAHGYLVVEEALQGLPSETVVKIYLYR